MRTLLCGLLALVALFLGPATAIADVVITLEAFTAGGQPIIGPVAAGTNATIDILLSADAEDAPVEDVRFIQFDFEATDDGIALLAFTWSVDENGYSFQDPDLPLTNVTSIMIMSTPDLLILTQEPVKVASVDILINGSGTLNVVNPANTFDDFGADVRAGFTTRERFNAMAGNMQGGSLDFTITDGGGGGTDPDQDSDGVPDAVDAFPDDPSETTDTDGNGVGDNADPDDDGDTVIDEVDDFPTDPDEIIDSDDDGIGDNADEDDDNDGVIDEVDSDPLDPNVGEVDNTNGNDNANDNGGGSGGGSPRACGAGMLGSGLFLLLGLGLMSFGTRRRTT